MRDLFATAAVNALYSAPCFAVLYPLAWYRQPELMVIYGLLGGLFMAIPFALFVLGMNLIGATAGAVAHLGGVPALPVAFLVALWLAFKFGTGPTSNQGDPTMLVVVSVVAVALPWVWRSSIFGLMPRTA